MYQVNFSKDRQKFAAAHFTIFEDGTVERLHGHNYSVTISLLSNQLQRGLVFPFHEAKKHIQKACDNWDEYVLLPANHPWLAVGMNDSQVEAVLRTPAVEKEYSFPTEDVRVLECDNISCENLARIFAENLSQTFLDLGFPVGALEISLHESAGQSVSYSVDVNSAFLETDD